MRGPHNFLRLVRTGATFERTGAMDVALDGLYAPASLKVAAKVVGLPFKWLGLRGDPGLPPVPRALTALGPAYIKFGQILSTRPDIVGEELAEQLKILQDKLPPFDDALARSEVLKAFDRPVEAIFSEFSAPIAAASIAQVHRARIAETDEDVAVKILRPGIERAFQVDIDAFYFIAGFIETFAPSARRLRPKAVIEHFESVVHGELDLRMEASASAEFRANASEDENFGVPRVIWPYSERRVFTSEWVDGINIGDLNAVRATGVDMRALANTIIQTFLSHALHDGFFHADMHQGNLKLAPDGKLIAIDFGIMGRIDEYTRRVYAEILIGFIRQDYKRIAEVHFEAGYVPYDQDVDAFAQALRSIGEPIFGQDASQISMARLLAHLFEVTEQFGMETRTELILLQRTMVVVEGVGRSLDPELNLWESAKPVVERYIRTNVGPIATVKDLTDTMRVLARFGPRLPQLAETALINATVGPAPRPKEPIPRWLIGGAGVVIGIFLSWVAGVF